MSTVTYVLPQSVARTFRTIIRNQFLGGFLVSGLEHLHAPYYMEAVRVLYLAKTLIIIMIRLDTTRRVSVLLDKAYAFDERDMVPFSNRVLFLAYNPKDKSLLKLEDSYFQNQIMRKDSLDENEAPDIREFRRILSEGGLEVERLKQKVKTNRIDDLEKMRDKIRELFRKHLLDFMFIGVTHLLLQMNSLFYFTTVWVTNEDLAMHEGLVKLVERCDRQR